MLLKYARIAAGNLRPRKGIPIRFTVAMIVIWGIARKPVICSITIRIIPNNGRHGHRHKILKIKQKGIKYNQRHPTAKLSQRLRKFGLTIEDYNRILDFQHGKCAICGCEIGDVMGNRLYVDHDHATGSVRGLLCSSCNFGLGNFHDDPQLLHNAIQYLEEGCI